MAQQRSQAILSQSIPVEWYKNYVPPTPTIRPKLTESHQLPDLELSPVDDKQITDNTTTSNISTVPSATTMSRSLMSGIYASSLPINKLKLSVNANYESNQIHEVKKQTGPKETEVGKAKEFETKKEPPKENITVGSYTCFQLIGGRTFVPKAVANCLLSHPKFQNSGETATLQISSQQDPSFVEEEVREDQFVMESDNEEEESD